MRHLLPFLLLGAAACQTPEQTKLPDPDAVGDAMEKSGDEAYELVRRTQANIRHYEELRRQGQLQQMAALRRNIGRTVDENFAAYRRLALDKKELETPRNWAVNGLGFAIERRRAAREALEQLLLEEPPPWLLANACLSLSVLADPETDLSRVIALIGHGDPEVRTSAATCVKEIWLLHETPRELKPQHYAAIDRLVALLNDRATTRGRRAAAWALANLRHPDTLDYLLIALKDSDDLVQIGGLRGIWLLGDARALEPLFEFLDGSPREEPASWARKALAAIAVQNGFAKTPSELAELGTSAKAWRNWFRAKRSQ